MKSGRKSGESEKKSGEVEVCVSLTDYNVVPEMNNKDRKINNIML